MDKQPRILVLSASVGAGHLRCPGCRIGSPGSRSRGDREKRGCPGIDQHRVSPALWKSVSRPGESARHVLGYFYDLLDQPSSSGRNRGDRLRLAVEKINLRSFIRFLKEEPWDLVINTHFLPAEIIASLRKKEELHLTQVTATTDFETHRLWVNQPCDHYFTATDKGTKYLQHWGVPAGQTTVTGIPIHPVFSKPKERTECLTKHGLVGDRPIVLQLAGGFGVGPIAKLFQGLLNVEQPIELVVIAGKNEKAKAELEALPLSDRHRVKILGFTTDIDELMAVADLVVSKPGGLTTSETLARSGDGDCQSNSGARGAQQRLPAGKRGGDQGQQYRDTALQDWDVIGRPGADGSVEGERCPHCQAASGV